MDCQEKAIELVDKFPELEHQRREDLCAAFSEAIEWGRNDATNPESPNQKLCHNHLCVCHVDEPDIANCAAEDLDVEDCGLADVDLRILEKLIKGEESNER